MAEGVSTSMDQLIGLLSNKGIIKITDAARDLKTDKSHIESWARMLEKEGIVQVHYSVIGGAVIRKGPNFDSIMKAVKSNITAERPKLIEASKVEMEQRQPTTEPKSAPEVEVRLKQPTPEPKSSLEEYALIRKKIEEGGQTFEEELQDLADEQEKVIECMTMLINEGRKLEDYIQNLKKVAKEVNAKRSGKLNSITTGKS